MTVRPTNAMPVPSSLNGEAAGDLNLVCECGTVEEYE